MAFRRWHSVASMRTNSARSPSYAKHCRCVIAAVIRPRPHRSPGEHITEGLDGSPVVDGLIDVWDRPGMGIEFTVETAGSHLL